MLDERPGICLRTDPTRSSARPRAEAAAFAQKTLDAMLAAPINNPGTKPRPGLPGVQYVGVPEFHGP